MPDWLQWRHALITGGGTGIGASAAAHLNAAGAKVIVLGRRPEPLERIRKIVGGTAVQADVTDRTQIDRAFDEARSAHGPIEILVVNAGIADSAPFAKTTRDSWDRIIATNLTAAFDCAQAALRDLLASEQRAAGVRRLGRKPARRALCRPLCRVEAWPARSDAQPRGRIRQDQPHRQRGLPGLCRHADDRRIGRARVADKTGRKFDQCARHHRQHERQRSAGAPRHDRRR